MKVYKDRRGWKYQVMAGMNCTNWKGRYQKPGASGPSVGWKGMRQLPWRNTLKEAQEDLDRLAEENGWEVVS